MYIYTRFFCRTLEIYYVVSLSHLKSHFIPINLVYIHTHNSFKTDLLIAAQFLLKRHIMYLYISISVKFQICILSKRIWLKNSL